MQCMKSLDFRGEVVIDYEWRALSVREMNEAIGIVSGDTMKGDRGSVSETASCDVAFEVVPCRYREWRILLVTVSILLTWQSIGSLDGAFCHRDEDCWSLFDAFEAVESWTEATDLL